MDEKLTVARNIKLMREASGYTQENIAAFLGITRSAYSNYELGTRELSLENIEKLADLYGCDGYMFYEENENIIESMLTTAFRVSYLSYEDMEQIAAFKRILTIQQAEILASKFRIENGIGLAEPVDTKTLLRKLKATAIYRPLSKNSYGISCKSKSGKMFFMINSNSTLGRQHFTIAHELYHMLYDENPSPHICCGNTTIEEANADIFASALLMPRDGVYTMLSNEEIIDHKIKITTILRIEQLFQVSRSMLLYRLKGMGVISENLRQAIQSIPVKESAVEYGYDKSLYEPGNGGVNIGDFGEKAKILFDKGQISEGHYIELLNMITHGREKN